MQSTPRETSQETLDRILSREASERAASGSRLAHSQIVEEGETPRKAYTVVFDYVNGTRQTFLPHKTHG